MDTYTHKLKSIKDSQLCKKEEKRGDRHKTGKPAESKNKRTNKNQTNKQEELNVTNAHFIKFIQEKVNVTNRTSQAQENSLKTKHTWELSQSVKQNRNKKGQEGKGKNKNKNKNKNKDRNYREDYKPQQKHRQTKNIKRKGDEQETGQSRQQHILRNPKQEEIKTKNHNIVNYVYIIIYTQLDIIAKSKNEKDIEMRDIQELNKAEGKENSQERKEGQEVRQQKEESEDKRRADDGRGKETRRKILDG